MSAYNISHIPHGSQAHHRSQAPYQDELWAAAQCRDAIIILERALIAPPLQLSNDARAAARVVVKMRDGIIEWLRQDANGAEAENRKEALNRLNTALDLILGVEYPSTGMRRKPVEQARDVLKSILVEGLF